MKGQLYTIEKSCTIETGLDDQSNDQVQIEDKHNWEEGVKKAINKFLSTSSLHGLSHIARSKTLRQRAKWVILLLSIATFYLVTTASILNKALNEVPYRISFMVKDKLTSDLEQMPLFPGVTICSYSPFTLKKRYTANLSRYIFLSLGPPFTGLTFKERGELLLPNQSLILGLSDRVSRGSRSSASSSILRAEEEFANLKERRHPLNLKDLVSNESIRCEELFTYCYLGDGTVDCCSIFKGYLTTNGMCFTFAPNETLQAALYRKPLSVDVSVPSDNATEREGVVFTFHDPRSIPLVKALEDGVAVWPGMMANVKYTLQVTDHKERYKGGDMGFYRLDCPNGNTINSQAYTQMNCENYMMMETIKYLCNCTLIIDERLNDTEHEQYCDPPKMFQCVLPKHSEIMDEVYKCKPACNEFNYQLSVNYARISREIKRTRKVRDGKVSLSIRQKDPTYEFLKYHHYTYSSTLSEIGGLMGLFLGASLITVIEITIFLLEYFWHYSTRIYKILINRSKKSLRISHA